MKIRSLLLGSVAAAGLSTGAFAADLGVLASLDVCDSLGYSGLTISSDTNCLQITGGVSYEFAWGDYDTDLLLVETSDGDFNLKDDDGVIDWKSRVDAWIKFVASAPTDFGPAKAVIKIKEVQLKETGFTTGGTPTVVFGGSDTADGDGYYFDEAYVSIGDSTVIMAGKKGTIQNKGDDVPLNFLGLFNSEKVDTGVLWTDGLIDDGGHVIQIVSDLGNGVSIGAGLENLNDSDYANAGVAVGVISYAGEGISAHATFVADGILDGTVDAWAMHAGFTGTFDMFKVVAALAADDTGYWNALASASATFDIFTLALSGEATDGGDWGVGGSASAAVTDGVTVNLGARWYHDDAVPNDAWQVAAQLVAAVTETITLTGEIGVYDSDIVDAVYYGAAQVAWAPGGGFTSSLKGEAYSTGAYKATFKAAKTFE